MGSYIITRNVIKDNQQSITMKGLVNLGNTCYLNSMLQCLLNCNPLVNHILKFKYQGDEASIIKFHKLVVMYWSDSQNVIKPIGALNMLCSLSDQFEGYRQQDTHEAYLWFIEGLHKGLQPDSKGTRYNVIIKDTEACKQWAEEKPSVITEIFMGQLKVTVDDVHYETFRSLELSTTKDTTIDALVFDFFKPEKTEDSNVVIKKRIQYPPLTLVLVVKQFFRKNKIKIKEHLDLSWFVEKPFKKLGYKLYGIVLHGGNRHGGHYISATKWNDQWYENNDSHVRKIKFSDVKINDIYMLFYLRDSNSSS